MSSARELGPGLWHWEAPHPQWEPTEPWSEIERENVQRRAVIGVNVRGRDIAGFVADAQAAIAAKVTLPPGYILRWGGQFEHLQTATQRLMIVVPIALALIFLLLFSTFHSLGLAALIYLAVPMAARARPRI